MTPERENELTREAQRTLRANDRGGYTVPTHGLYPYQWNWDAGVTALGWMTFDEPRAWEEYRWLIKGQWNGGPQDGLIPHIVFHQGGSDSYFPGPGEWGAPKTDPPSSAISQPPLHATMLRWMWQRAHDKRLAAGRLREIIPAIARHHAWWYRTRDPDASGLVTVIHPWETGRDNSPAWDVPLARVPRTTRPYRRRDLDHVDAAERPTHEFYDRVVWLIDFYRAAGFDPATILRECPFRIVDAAIVFILHRATKDLLALADELGLHLLDRAALAAALARTEAAAPRLWNDAPGQFVDFDLAAGSHIEQSTSGGFLSWYAGIASHTQAATLAAWLDETPFGVPSTRASEPGFDAKRYWRGPVWQHMNLLTEVGLRDCGETALAERVRASSLALFDRSGFCEYYDPLTGAGLGGATFSWTAATWLHRCIPGGGGFWGSPHAPR
jgi:glycogen debranching enzyme